MLHDNAQLYVGKPVEAEYTAMTYFHRCSKVESDKYV